MRHPIYGGLPIADLGLVLVTADVLSIAVAATTALGLPVLARLEEEFLLGRYPGDYAADRQSTGCFLLLWPKPKKAPAP